MEMADEPEANECRYSMRPCHRRPLVGYKYCRTHILEDKTSGYHQCSYVSLKTGRHCTQPANKNCRKEWYVSPSLSYYS